MKNNYPLYLVEFSSRFLMKFIIEVNKENYYRVIKTNAHGSTFRRTFTSANLLISLLHEKSLIVKPVSKEEAAEFILLHKLHEPTYGQE